MSQPLTRQELQTLRNTGNEAETAAEEIEQLRELAWALVESLESAVRFVPDITTQSEMYGRIRLVKSALTGGWSQ